MTAAHGHNFDFSPIGQGLRPTAAAPTKLFGYEVIEQLGEGAGSLVYAVASPLNGQIFALKHVVRKVEKDQRFIEQLENEFNVGKQINHPALRRMIDFKANRTLFGKVTDAVLVMELFDGHSLEAHQPHGLSELLNCFIDTASALAALNDAGFVHCDLKPNNILRGNDGSVKVIDLGQACREGVAKPRIQGTPDFISPEQVHCKPVSKSTDVFNFGATLYWAVTHQKLQTLFTLKKGENSFLLDDAIATPISINPALPVALSNLIMECVRTLPSKRPADLHEVKRRLDVIQYVMERSSASRPLPN